MKQIHKKSNQWSLILSVLASSAVGAKNRALSMTALLIFVNDMLWQNFSLSLQLFMQSGSCEPKHILFRGNLSSLWQAQRLHIPCYYGACIASRGKNTTTLLVGSTCDPSAVVSCSYHDIGVRCCVVGLFCGWPGGLGLVTRLSLRSDKFLDICCRDLKTFVFLFD